MTRIELLHHVSKQLRHAAVVHGVTTPAWFCIPSKQINSTVKNMKRIVWSLLVTSALSFGVVACGGGEDENNSSGSCANDNDCKGDRICAAGECVDPSGSGGGTGNSSNGGGETGNSSNGGGETGNSSNGGGETGNSSSGGAIGDTCDEHGQCDSQFCRKPAGAFDGKCAINDFGEMCQGNSDCEYGACLVANDLDDFGYCTTTCSDFSDCPTFWNCEEVGNANGTYCSQ